MYLLLEKRKDVINIGSNVLTLKNETRVFFCNDMYLNIRNNLKKAFCDKTSFNIVS